MGFPEWTLVGMGVTGLGALIFILIAYLALSPGAVHRLGLTGARLDLRVKSFIGYALACLLLMAGFFLAGVPLEPVEETAVSTAIPNELDTIPESQATVIVFATPTLADTVEAESTDAEGEDEPEETRPASSGAMGELPPSDEEEVEPESGAFTPLEDEEEAEETPEGTATPLPEAGPSSTPIPSPSATPVTSTPTMTPSPSPTVTPTPTLTPTPIDGETAVVELNGGVIWLQRAPGGQNLIVLEDQAIVIVRNGRANRDGILWREVTSVDGVTGWLQETYLNYEN